jgi:hypothetical protein
MPRAHIPADRWEHDAVSKLDEVGHAIDAVKRVVVSALLAVSLVVGLSAGLVVEFGALRKAVLNELSPETTIRTASRPDGSSVGAPPGSSSAMPDFSSRKASPDCSVGRSVLAPGAFPDAPGELKAIAIFRIWVDDPDTVAGDHREPRVRAEK